MGSEQNEQRKLRQVKELYHKMMIVIPFFYTSEPSTILAVRCKTNITQIYNSKYVVQQKLYYDRNTPQVTQIICFPNVEEATIVKKEIEANYIQNAKQFCYYCKDISDCAGILFQLNTLYVVPPQTAELKQIINDIAQLVIVDGIAIEQLLKRQFQSYPILSFLRQRTLSIQNIYYRWRVYSYLMGDGQKKYRTDSYQMIKNGSWWYPPLSMNQLPIAVMNVKKVLYFTKILQTMNRKKYAIQEAMIFAVYNVDYAAHVTSIIIVHLLQHLKDDFLGYFYLISDILFNSTNFEYRNLFQAILPYLIYQYVFLVQNKQIQVKQVNQLKNIFCIWDKKYFFEQNFMKGIKILLTLTQINKVYQLKSMNEHSCMKNIMQSQNWSIQLQRQCTLFGLPCFETKVEEAKLFMNYYFWLNEEASEVQPQLGKYDGQALTQKDLIKIKSKQIKVNACESLPLSFLRESDWKSLSLQNGNNSQDFE